LGGKRVKGGKRVSEEVWSEHTPSGGGSLVAAKRVKSVKGPCQSLGRGTCGFGARSKTTRRGCVVGVGKGIWN